LETDFTTDQVLGKYLDLQANYETLVRDQLARPLRNNSSDNNNETSASTTTSNTSMYQYIDFLEDLSYSRMTSSNDVSVQTSQK